MTTLTSLQSALDQAQAQLAGPDAAFTTALLASRIAADCAAVADLRDAPAWDFCALELEAAADALRPLLSHDIAVTASGPGPEPVASQDIAALLRDATERLITISVRNRSTSADSNSDAWDLAARHLQQAHDEVP